MRCALLVVGGLVGCTPTSSPTSDASDGHNAILHLAWAGNPTSLPAATSGTVTATSFDLHVREVRVIGDAGPGDPRTFQSETELVWADHELPQVTDFPMAPLGKYSRVAFELESESLAPYITIEGQVAIDNAAPVPFVLTDLAHMRLSVDVDAELAAGVDTTITVGVDLASVVNAIDYKSLPSVGGTRTLAPGDAQATVLEAKLANAFHAIHVQ